jgi:plastocyanin
VVVIAAVAAISFSACGGDGGDDAGGGGGAEEAGGSVTLTAADFAFDPETLTAAVGDTIEFTNEDDAEHNFTAEDADLDEDVDGGQSVSIDLADVEPGSYDFVCEYHPDSMTGTLEVTE